MKTKEQNGTRFLPVPHQDLIDEIARGLEKRGWLNVPEFRIESKDKQQIAVYWLLAPPNKAKIESTGNWILGLINSNHPDPGRRGAIRIVGGLQGPIVLGSYQLGRHTKTFDIVARVRDGLGWFEKATQKGFPRLIALLKQNRISLAEAEHLLCEATMMKLIPGSRSMQALKRFRAMPEQTSWGLLNTFSNEARRGPKLQQLERMNKFLNLLTKKE